MTVGLTAYRPVKAFSIVANQKPGTSGTNRSQGTERTGRSTANSNWGASSSVEDRPQWAWRGSFNNSSGTNNGSGENYGANVGQGSSAGASWGSSEVMDFLVEPNYFATGLRTGGPANRGLVDAVFFRAGANFTTRRTDQQRSAGHVQAMNRPNSTDLLLGSRRTGTVIGLLVVGSIYYCAQAADHAPALWALPCGLVLLGRKARLARKRVAVANGWDQRWQAMSGEAPDPKAAPRKRRPTLLVTGSVAWLLTAWWLSTHDANTTPDYAAFAFWFLGLSAWGAGAALLAFSRALLSLARGTPRPDSAARASKRSGPAEQLVTVCPHVPFGSPTLPQITAALPDYCQTLLARSRAASAD